MRRSLVAVLTFACLGTSAAPRVAAAQVPPAILVGDRAPKPAGPRTIVGIVVDTLAQPVDSAEVVIASTRRRVLTSGGGLFRFDNVDTGTYQIIVTHPAHQPQTQSVAVDSDGAVATFVLVPLARMLAPVIVLGDREPKPAGARTLVGIVTDVNGTPIDSVDIVIPRLQRRRASNASGVFQFDDIRPGRYDVSARRIGYYPQSHTVTVERDGGVVKFVLVQVIRALAPVITTVARGGLSGVVADTAFAIVPGAEVSVVASDRRATTDSTGSFFLDVKPGKYMVRVKRAGFTSRLLSVIVPRDSGRKVIVWLAPASGGSQVMEEWRIEGLRQRLMIRSGATSVIWTRDEIMRMPMTELSQLAIAGSGLSVDDQCPAVIDGGPRTAALWEVLASDIETLEVYPPGSLMPAGASRIRSVRPTSIRSQGVTARPPEPRGGGLDRDPCKGVHVYVWLRK